MLSSKCLSSEQAETLRQINGNHLNENLINLVNKKTARIHQPVEITDIVVRQTVAVGEYASKTAAEPEKIKNRLVRMEDTIEALAALANQIHLDKNFNVDEQNHTVEVKENCKNNVTRMLMHEFSFYPRGKALTLNEFQDFVGAVEKIAAKLNGNLYLLLSSIPVENPNNTVTNHVLHVQCGPLPKINIITKITPHLVDPEYANTSKATYKAEYKRDKHAACILLPSKKIKDPATNYGEIIRCETLGGAQFFTAIEICLDHVIGEAKRSFQHDIIKQACQQKFDLLPLQISHVVTSASVSFYPNNGLANMVRADFREKYGYSDKNTLPSKFTDSLYNKLSVGDQLNQKYPNIKLKNLANTVITLVTPPFGHDLKIEIYPSTKVDLVRGISFDAISQHNLEVCQNRYNNPHTLFASKLVQGSELKATRENSLALYRP